MSKFKIGDKAVVKYQNFDLYLNASTLFNYINSMSIYNHTDVKIISNVIELDEFRYYNVETFDGEIRWLFLEQDLISYEDYYNKGFRSGGIVKGNHTSFGDPVSINIPEGYKVTTITKECSHSNKKIIPMIHSSFWLCPDCGKDWDVS